MAEVLASLKKIGGNGEQYTETVLWTNPSPTASFATQTVTLSDSITNYKYLLIRYKDGNSGSDIFDDICAVTDFIESVYDKSAVHSQFGISMQNSGNRLRTRAVGYVSATSIKFSACYNCNTTGSDDTCAIPLEILGINELAHQTVGERYDVLPAVTVNAGTKPTFTTKGQAKAIFMTYMVANGTVAYTLTNVNPYTGEYDNADLYRTATNSSEITHVGNGNPFIVTANTITTTSPLSSSQQTKHIMSYTY